MSDLGCKHLVDDTFSQIQGDASEFIRVIRHIKEVDIFALADNEVFRMHYYEVNVEIVFALVFN